MRSIYGFLSNRQARVRFNDCMSTNRTMKQGLPQGSVLSPLLFLFYINGLADLLPTENINALFADDVGILATAPTISEAEEKAQAAVDVVSEWSKQAKISLNATKSECSVFTTDRRQESKATAKISIDGKTIPFNKTPKLLGVYLDRELTFGKHVKEISIQAKSKLRMLSALSHTTWGCLKQDIMKVYIGNIQSKMDYAAPGWQPWLSNTTLESLDVIQNKALRIATGNIQKSRLSVCRRETNTPSYKTISKRSIIRSKEKAERLPEDHPRKLALTNKTKPKNARQSWRRKADELSAQYLHHTETEKQPIPFFARAPWDAPDNLTVVAAVPGIAKKSDDHAAMVEATLKQVRNVSSGMVVYTDGSATAGTTNGGAGVVITQGDPTEYAEIETIKKKGANKTSSYEEEVAAMSTACEWIQQECTAEDKVVICTDSLSLCQALESLNEGVDPTIKQISKCDAEITVQWVPAHTGIPGNEAADLAAKEATRSPGLGRPISFSSACAFIRHSVLDDPPTDSGDKRIMEIYGAYNHRRDKAQIQNREDQVHLSRLRSGNHPSMNYYQHKFDERIENVCPRCNDGEDTVEHWLNKCPAMEHIKMHIFGRTKLEPDILTREPGKCMMLARRSVLKNEPLGTFISSNGMTC